MSWIDRALGVFAPERAFRREAARARLRMLRGYDAGRVSERDRGWITASDGPNSAIGPFAARVRDRARALVRDNPYAARLVQVQAAHQVGYGITPRVDTGSPSLDRRVMSLWDAFVASADVSGTQDLHGLVALLARTRAQDGEALARLIRPSAQEMRQLKLPVPLQVEALEADWIDDDKDSGFSPASGEGLIIRGIELDRRGRRRAVWLRRAHPGEHVVAARESQRVPAEDVLHLYRVLRPGQQRGISDFAPILKRLYRLDQYEEAALEKARIEACLTAFVTTDADAAQSPLGAERPRRAMDENEVVFGVGMVNWLRPGESVETVAPTGAGGFESFSLHVLMSVATGAGCTYDQLTGDLRQANFSSLRAGKIEFRRLVMQDQWLIFVPRLMQPIWRAFIDAAVLSGQLPEGEYPVRWSPPPFEMIDPNREVPPLIAKMRAGMVPPQEVIGALGEDWRDVIEQFAEWYRVLDERGLIFDSDPRRTAESGRAQDARQNAAVELAAETAER